MNQLNSEIQSQTLAPEFLPRMGELQQAAAFLVQHAAHEAHVGQMIVADLRRHEQNLEAEIMTLQRECVDEMNAIKRQFEDRVGRIQGLREGNARMIEFYVGQSEAQEPVTVPLQAAQPSRPRQRTMLQKIGLA